MNLSQEEFLQSLDGDLTAQQAANLLELGLQGDTTVTSVEEGGLPAASASNADAGATAGDADENKTNVADAAKAGAVDAGATSETDPANTVILAKDGKHTIGYEKLVEAREAAANAKTLLDAANQELATLRAEAQKRADSGEAATKLDNQVAAADAAIAAGVDASLFGDFSEEALAKGIQTLVNQRVEAALAPLNAKLEPIQAKQVVDANTAHYNAIYSKHPDADSIAESKELADWIASQPSFARAGYQTALSKGSTAEVVELFDTFKAATGKTPVAAAANPADVKAAAKAVIASAKPSVPASLTDFPGGTAGPGTRDEALAGMDSGTDLLSAMENMTPAQIESYLNRAL